MDLLKLIAVFFVGMIGSFVGAMVGSGGLISIPFLIFLGLPPHVAIATHKFGAVGLKLGAAIRFRKTEHVQWQYFIPFSILSFCAALIGTQILININKELLLRVVGVILLAMLPIIFLQRETGVTHQEVLRWKRNTGYGLYFLIQIFAAFFGGGAATIVYYVLMMCFGLTIVEASASTMLPTLFMTVTSLIIFGFHGFLDYRYGAAIFLGMLAGGWLGAHTAIAIGNVWVKVLFTAIVLFSAAKLLWG